MATPPQSARARGSRSKNCIVKKRGAFCVHQGGERGPVASMGLPGAAFIRSCQNKAEVRLHESALADRGSTDAVSRNLVFILFPIFEDQNVPRKISIWEQFLLKLFSFF